MKVTQGLIDAWKEETGSIKALSELVYIDSLDSFEQSRCIGWMV